METTDIYTTKYTTHAKDKSTVKSHTTLLFFNRTSVSFFPTSNLTDSDGSEHSTFSYQLNNTNDAKIYLSSPTFNPIINETTIQTGFTHPSFTASFGSIYGVKTENKTTSRRKSNNMTTTASPYVSTIRTFRQ